MTKQNMQDERTVAQRRKINSEALGILMIVLLGSIFVQQAFQKAPFEQYAVEVICFLGISVYMVVRHIMLGLNIYGEGKPAKGLLLLNSMVAGIAVAAINGVLNYTQYSEQYKADGIGYFFAVLAITFFSATVLTFAVLSFFNYLNLKKQSSIQKRLDQSEQDE